MKTYRPALRVVASAVALSIASAASAQTLGQGASTDVPWLRLLLALCLCLSLAAAAAWAVKTRIGGSSSPALKPSLASILSRLRVPMARSRTTPGALRLIDSLHLPNQLGVSLLDCEGRRYMIVSSAQGQIEIVQTPTPSGGEDVAS